MSGEMCPNCNTLLTSSLKFCVNCRRSVTEDKIKTGAETKEEESGSKFKLARGATYDGLRQVRTFFFTLTTLLLIAFVYYFVMKFVIHEPVPFEDEIDKFVGGVKNSIPAGTGTGTTPSAPSN